MTDWEVRNLYAHATADVLSQNVPTCSCCRLIGWSSRASQLSMAPASSRSLMVMDPDGFWSVTSCAWMSAGHSTCQINGCNGLSPLHHTPPAPNLQALLYPMYDGYSTMSCRTDVGWLVKYLTIYAQSCSVDTSIGVMVMKGGLHCMAC